MRVFTEIALSDLFNATLTSTLFVQTDVYEFKCYVFFLKTVMLQILYINEKAK